MHMPNGRRRKESGPEEPRFDSKDVEREIQRNREQNERFQREYSAWFERHSTERPPKRKNA